MAVVEHGPDDGAEAIAAEVAGWLADPGIERRRSPCWPGELILLAPHVALRAAGIPLNSALTPDLLTRTGLRAALAYLRIAANAGGSPPPTLSRSCDGRRAVYPSGFPSASLGAARGPSTRSQP